LRCSTKKQTNSGRAKRGTPLRGEAAGAANKPKTTPAPFYVFVFVSLLLPCAALVDMGEPGKNDEIWKQHCNQVMKQWMSTWGSDGAPGVPTPQVCSAYRLPMPGESVTVSGIRRRPELNGACGEVVDGGLDEHGRIGVRLFGTQGRGQGGMQSMRIQPFRLRPLGRSTSLGGLGGASSGSQGVESAASWSAGEGPNSVLSLAPPLGAPGGARRGGGGGAQSSCGVSSVASMQRSLPGGSSVGSRVPTGLVRGQTSSSCGKLPALSATAGKVPVWVRTHPQLNGLKLEMVDSSTLQ